MPIKVGFSSTACPEWDLNRMVQRAGEMGYDGVELRALAGESYLPAAGELADDPGAVKSMIAAAGVELVCLSSSASFETWSAREAEADRRRLIETIELAGRLGCPYVRIQLGKTVGGEHRGTLSRVVVHLSELAPIAARHGTAILVENAGHFTNSEDLWFVIDAVAHPGVRGCWNTLNARVRGERPTMSVPRLGRKIDLVHVADGRFDREGRFLGHELPGQGGVELDRAVQLLKGVCYQGWLVVDWPVAAPALGDPDGALPRSLEFLRRELAATQQVLSAYKGDKRPPNFHAPPAVQPVADK